MYYFNVIVNVSPSPEPQRHDARHRHEEDEACGREKPAGIAEIHFLAGDGLFPDEPVPCPDGLPTESLCRYQVAHISILELLIYTDNAFCL